tara:strand:+ start:467 stop:1630 length:1164 start_codon:yes stop_codon:yes gene_type:complete
MKSINFFSLLLIVAVISFSSCEKDNEPAPNPGPELPSTYNFENVSFGGQTDRLDMMGEMTAEMKSANSGGTVDGTKLVNMFSNSNSPFSAANLNASTKQLKSKCFSDGTGGIYDADTYEYLMNYYAGVTQTATGAWTPGNAGVSTNGNKSYFFDAYGVEYTQIIEKGLMGAVFYYQAAESYTREGKIGDAVDNVIITPNEGTDMEHHWDEAFGYFGVPTDLTVANFDTKLDAGEVRYHGKYAGVGQDAGLNTVGKVMNEFIKGRFGISNNDYTMRDQAASQLRAEWEMVIATTAIHYLNEAQSNFSDETLRNHELSEALAFIMSLHYNSDKLMSSTEINTILDYFKETPTGAPNAVFSLLNVTNQNINDAKDMISAAYGLNSVKDIL